jgi:hypothetical protein
MRGDNVAWFVEGSEINSHYFQPNEKVLDTVEQVVELNPRAVFVPGNLVPDFIPGLKIQVFTVLNGRKRVTFESAGVLICIAPKALFSLTDSNKFVQLVHISQ